MQVPLFVHDEQNIPELIVHHPLSGGAYAFREDFIRYLSGTLDKDEVYVSIGAQPNSSPHLGTLLVASLAFSLCDQLSSYGRRATVFFEVVDTAPATIEVIDGVPYQVSLRHSDVEATYLAQYIAVLEELSKLSQIGYTVRRQQEFAGQKAVADILRQILSQSEEIVPILSPVRRTLGLRRACPVCGLTDKHGLRNTYRDNGVESHCPRHGKFSTHIDTESARLEFSTPLRNLVRALVYATANADQTLDHRWLRLTGGDYAGFYQEELLYRCASRLGYAAHTLPRIVYAPLVTDWSGAKLSKSLCALRQPYQYLPPWLIDFAAFKTHLGGGGLETLFQETSLWLREPFRLFRTYSVFYFMERFASEAVLAEVKASG